MTAAVRPLLVYRGSIQGDVKKLTVRNLEAHRILKELRTIKRHRTNAPAPARWTSAVDVPVVGGAG